MIKSFLLLSSILLSGFSSFGQSAAEVTPIDVNRTYHGCCRPVRKEDVFTNCMMTVTTDKDTQEKEDLLDITDPEMRSFSASPNPTKGFFTVSVPPSLFGRDLLLMDMTGRFIGNPIPITEAVTAINLEGDAGIYLVSIRTESEVITERILLDK